jgi:hypothetical protein
MHKESETELQRARGQLRYLKTLAQNKARVDKEDAQQESDTKHAEEKKLEDVADGSGDEAKECVICQEPLKKDSDVAILLCGHEFCCPCIMTMVDRYRTHARTHTHARQTHRHAPLECTHGLTLPVATLGRFMERSSVPHAVRG